MSSTIIAFLLHTNQQIIRYCGISILFGGLIGGILNIIVFLSLRTFRQNTCAFYLTVLSIVNIMQLITGLFSRIMITGFNIDWTYNSLFYCKFRTFSFQLSSLMSFVCISFATIDQYLTTCSPSRWPQWCTLKRARCMIVVALCIAFIQQSPCLIFYNLVHSNTTDSIICDTTNMNFILYNSYFNYLILGNILPCSITFSFGLMTYYNIQQISYRTKPFIRRELDKQLSRMVLIQVVYTILSISPNGILYSILAFANIQDPVRFGQLRLGYSLMTILYYTCFASPFYIYICVSERFRRQVLYVLSKMFSIHEHHQIAPQ
ncbi:hypothetical protein I4U23_001470 [Adineta vaga]|nr:hypothetical protein I4U23_001470 [Adineta vaga]